ncbi:MAG: hypothetical protein DBX55_01710, partial [Verrucomicrobia bacterium]
KKMQKLFRRALSTQEFAGMRTFSYFAQKRAPKTNFVREFNRKILSIMRRKKPCTRRKKPHETQPDELKDGERAEAAMA